MLTSTTDRRMQLCDVLREASIHRTNTKSQTDMLFSQKED